MLPASGPTCLQVAGSSLRLVVGVEPLGWSQEDSRGSAFWALEYKVRDGRGGGAGREQGAGHVTQRIKDQRVIQVSGDAAPYNTHR